MPGSLGATMAICNSALITLKTKVRHVFHQLLMTEGGMINTPVLSEGSPGLDRRGHNTSEL